MIGKVTNIEDALDNVISLSDWIYLFAVWHRRLEKRTKPNCLLGWC